MARSTVDGTSLFGWLCATLWRISSMSEASQKSAGRFITERGYLKERGSFTLKPVGCRTDTPVCRLAPAKVIRPGLITGEDTRMSIKKVNGYWTIHSGDEPVVSCASLEAALALIEQVAVGGVA